MLPCAVTFKVIHSGRLPFASRCICEAGFSTQVHIKSKSVNKVDVDDMRLAITKNPEVQDLLMSCNSSLLISK